MGAVVAILLLAGSAWLTYLSFTTPMEYRRQQLFLSSGTQVEARVISTKLVKQEAGIKNENRSLVNDRHGEIELPGPEICHATISCDNPEPGKNVTTTHAGVKDYNCVSDMRGKRKGLGNAVRLSQFSAG